MSFGICLNVCNYLYFNQKMNIYTEFLPRIIFMLSIFGYLVILIIYKWLTFWPDASRAPGLLNTLIYMFLSPGNVGEKDQLYRGQVRTKGLLEIFYYYRLTLSSS